MSPDRQAIACRVERNRSAKVVTCTKCADIHIFTAGITISNGGLQHSAGKLVIRKTEQIHCARLSNIISSVAKIRTHYQAVPRCVERNRNAKAVTCLKRAYILVLLRSGIAKAHDPCVGPALHCRTIANDNILGIKQEMSTLTYGDIHKRCLAQIIGRGNFYRSRAGLATRVNLAQKSRFIIRPDNGRSARTRMRLHIDLSGIVDHIFLAGAQRWKRTPPANKTIKIVGVWINSFPALKGATKAHHAAHRLARGIQRCTEKA